MSEERTNYMAELEAWCDEMVIVPLLDNGTAAIERVRKNIRTKVLESYHNGQAAGPRRFQAAPRKGVR
jgi:hypothetical protein